MTAASHFRSEVSSLANPSEADKGKGKGQPDHPEHPEHPPHPDKPKPKPKPDHGRTYG
jgi:hypothetical protein